MFTKKRIEKTDDVLMLGSTWETEIIQTLYSRIKLYRAGTAFCAFVAACLALALVLLMPLKTAVPYVVRVDNTDGIVDIVSTLDEEITISQDEAIAKYFIAKYVKARESYQRQTAESNYEIVRLLSSPQTFVPYEAWFAPSNEKSPLNTFADNIDVSVQIRSINFLNEESAVVSLDKMIDDRKGNAVKERWAITMSYRYTKEPVLLNDRLTNPVGFTVTRYKIDQEIFNGDQTK